MAKRNRYYKVDEMVWIRSMKTTGVIQKLDIRPEEEVYRAKVEITTRQVDNETRMVKTLELDLWDIDKYKPNRAEEKEVLGVPVRYFDKDLPQIEKLVVGDWIDLRARKHVKLNFVENALIPLNVAMELPDGYEAILAPRSSTFDKYGIIQANGIGVIDNSYAGNDDEWMMNGIALSNDVVIRKGDRIAQFRIQRKMDKNKYRFYTVEKLAKKNRGGFGSTGTN